MKKLFFIDYDNTIFSHRTNQIPKSALKAIQRLQDEGHKFILASGRCLRRSTFPAFSADLHPDCLVGSNGAIVEAEGHLLKDAPLDPDLQKRFFAFLKETGYSVTANYQEQFYASNPERFLTYTTLRKSLASLDRADFFALEDKPLYSFFLHDTRAVGRELEQHFPELKLLYMHDDEDGADIIPKDNSKANGMKLILDYYHASPADAVAIGDSMNDVELIQQAGLGIAMGNAMTATKKAAGYITADVDKDGLAQAIEYAISFETA